ncbi:MAG: Maf family protein [Acidaminococcaceae bacterium]|jgi:septum formation protein|nr:Maf family protein [Acidaminococcaceae bacterium]
MHYILASASPRRLTLLQQIGIEPKVVVSDFSEATKAATPEELVQANAGGKAATVAKRYPGSVVIAADTVVVWQDTILGKPHDTAEAKEMLGLLSGQEHQVITGLAVYYQAKHEVIVETTKVKFRQLNQKEIDEYVSTGEPLDKAGAYGIQGRGAVLIEKICGCYSNVVGLPLTRLYQILQIMDVIPDDQLLHQGITK